MEDFGIAAALKTLTSESLIEALLMVVVASVLIAVLQAVLPRIARQFGGKVRLYMLASVPLLRLLIIVVTITLVVPTLIQPTFENMVAIFGALALALGFAFKDYANSLIAGIVTLYEMPYRPGDWIDVDGRYGEVRSIGTRAAKIVTPDDTVVIIPHGRLWNGLIANGNDGTHHLMCVTDFFLAPGHDVASVLACLRDVGIASPLTKTYLPVTVVSEQQPWGFRYALKAYPVDPRDQFRFRTALLEAGHQALQALGVHATVAPAVPAPGNAWPTKKGDA